MRLSLFEDLFSEELEPRKPLGHFEMDPDQKIGEMARTCHVYRPTIYMTIRCGILRYHAFPYSTDREIE